MDSQPQHQRRLATVETEPHRGDRRRAGRVAGNPKAAVRDLRGWGDRRAVGLRPPPRARLHALDRTRRTPWQHDGQDQAQGSRLDCGPAPKPGGSGQARWRHRRVGERRPARACALPTSASAPSALAPPPTTASATARAPDRAITRASAPR